MKSRTSFFNPTVFRKDITRFAPAWVLYFIGGVLVALNTATSDSGNTTYELYQLLPLAAIVSLLYGLINAQLLFGDLLSKKMCNALHAMPIRRETWFITHFAAGILFQFVPNTLFAFFMGCFMGQYWYLALLWLLATTAQYLFFFSVAIFCITCTGQRFAGVALYGLVNFLSMLAMWFVNSFYTPLLKGIVLSNRVFNYFSPAVQLIGLEGDYVRFTHYLSDVDHRMHYEFKGYGDSWWYLIAVAAAAVVFAVAALLLYRRRKLERAGDFIAFRWLEPAFSILLTLCAGAFLQLLFGSVFMFVGFIIGFYVSQMLLQRKVNIFKKKTFITLGIFAGVMVLSLVLTALDPLGITRWTPQTKQVKSVALTDDYNYDPLENDPYYLIALEDDAAIEDVIEIHEMLIKEGFSHDRTSLVSGVYTPRRGVTLVYTLENGQTVSRSYYYDTDSQISAALKKFYTRPEFIMGYTNWDHFIENATEVSIDNKTVNGQQAQGLLEALKSDCEAGAIYTLEYKYSDVLFFVEFRYGDKFRNVGISADCKNTIEYVKAHIPDWKEWNS